MVVDSYFQTKLIFNLTLANGSMLPLNTEIPLFNDDSGLEVRANPYPDEQWMWAYYFTGPVVAYYGEGIVVGAFSEPYIVGIGASLV